MKPGKSFREEYFTGLNVLMLINLGNPIKIVQTISFAPIFPASHTTVLGGVATGNMNENEELIVTGNIRYKGWVPILRDYKTKTQNLREVSYLTGRWPSSISLLIMINNSAKA